MGVAVSTQTGQHITSFKMKLIAPVVAAILATIMLASAMKVDLANDSQAVANVAVDGESAASWSSKKMWANNYYYWKPDPRGVWNKIQVKAKLGYGCHKNRCWSYCGINFRGGQWCYTNSKNGKGYKYCSKTVNCYQVKHPRYKYKGMERDQERYYKWPQRDYLAKCTSRCSLFG